MTKSFQNLARRFGDARPGLQLVAVEDAAVPVTMLRVDVLAQERQPLPIAEEFILRFVAQGVDDPVEIAAVLGLDENHILEAAAAQVSAENLRQTLNGKLRLTTLGVEAARDLASVQPVDRPLPVAFDRLAWRMAEYSENDLVEKQAAKDAGMRILPAERNARIGVDDIPVADFNSMLKSDKLQILRVRRTTTKKHRYLPVQLLVYADTATGELDLAVCLEDRLAIDHSIALTKIGAVERLGLRFESTDDRPVLDDELESQRTRVPQGTAEADVDAESAEEPVTASSLVRSVSVFEHPDLLNEALQSASERLLIISPWVRRAVITTDFISRVEQRLRAGVTVTIAHGYGDDDSGSDTDALRRLKNLADRYDKFTFVRVKNTHAKILIFDQNWVSTSFNWLSFKGDPERTYRMEEGTLVTIPSRVDSEYVRYLELIDEQRQG
jgi:hypothetical protein